MKKFLLSDRAGMAGFGILALLIAVALLTGQPQAFTGDEPRYVLYAASILKHGTFVMPLAEWQQLVYSATHSVPADLPAGGNGVVMNSVYLSTLLSPIASMFFLPGLRATTLLAGLVGLFHLFRLCKRFSAPASALIAVAIAGFTLPLLPYLHLFYMETYIFALACIGWERLQTATRNTAGDLVTAVIILIIPYVHLRGAVIAAALFILLLWQLRSRRMLPKAAAFMLLAMVALAGLVTLNLLVYGAITGPVNTARPPYPTEWFAVLSMQSFNVRHGIFAYAPVWLLGYAGLGLGAWRGSSIAKQGCVLALLAAVTSMGINPGECWPARFWVISIPMLTIGFCTWWEIGRQPLLRIVTVVLILFTLSNTALFIASPNSHLENRQTTTTYQQLFDKFGRFNFGLMLPVEVDDQPNLAAARNMAIAAGLFVMLLGIAAARRQPWFAAPAVLILALAIDHARVSVVPPADYVLSRQGNQFQVRLKTPLPAVYVQFGHTWQTWFTSPDWHRFSVTIEGAGGQQVIERLASNQVISAACTGNIGSLTVAGPLGFDIGAEVDHRLVVYRSDSWLRTWLGDPRYRC